MGFKCDLLPIISYSDGYHPSHPAAGQSPFDNPADYLSPKNHFLKKKSLKVELQNNVSRNLKEHFTHQNGFDSKIPF